ncbi:ribosomal RNA-processing protein 7 homolog A-like [Montipora foliosa]|uniref:ribosomal RNA-processing protein 7 homolog A-like n=1 Tax=Montipora foliosa TaxID=591990 RepID=UPI0035F1C93F
MASEIAGSRTICVKFNEKCVTYHYLYCKKHMTRDENASKPPDKTLFVVNIPPYCTKGALKHLFSCCGVIKDVYLMKYPGSEKKEQEPSNFITTSNELVGFKVGYIVFKKSSSLDAALNLDSSTIRVLSTAKKPVVTGMKKWVQEYQMQYPDATQLQTKVDEFMAQFDAKKEQSDKEAADTLNKPDDEGWVTVGRSGRNPAARRIDADKLHERRKKKKKRELLNFYQFQLRETRREHIANLRKKFEEDRKRVAEMKSARKFRPY